MSKNGVIFGFLLGILFNMLGILLYLSYLKFTYNYPIHYSIEVAIQNNTLGNVVALGALPNLGLFFFLLNKNKIYAARGVVIATLLAAIYVFVTKF